MRCWLKVGGSFLDRGGSCLDHDGYCVTFGCRHVNYLGLTSYFEAYAHMSCWRLELPAPDIPPAGHLRAEGTPCQAVRQIWRLPLVTDVPT